MMKSAGVREKEKERENNENFLYMTMPKMSYRAKQKDQENHDCASLITFSMLLAKSTFCNLKYKYFINQNRRF